MTQQHLLTIVLLGVLAVSSTSNTVQCANQPAHPRLKKLPKMYLLTHGLAWLDITPDDPRRKTSLWEQWPGRCEVCYQYEFGLKEKYYRLVRQADNKTGIFCLPDGMRGNTELIEYAKKKFGDRCVVCRLGYDQDANRKALGEVFTRGLDEDRARAEAARGKDLSQGEIAAWERSKAWTVDLRSQFEAQGYTFDPATVKFITFGEDWSGCAATFPIHMGRAFGLKHPIDRRFDLINPDCTPVLLTATPVEQSLAMPENLRLYLFRTAEGWLVGQYWEGMHALFDKPHRVTVKFPPDSARLIDTFGKPRGEQRGGQITMEVGCGGHTPYRADLVQAEPKLTLARFRKALLTGLVSER